MKRTMCIATFDSEIIAIKVVQGVYDAHALESICKEVHENYPQKLKTFYQQLGFTNLRRHHDTMNFIDLDDELADIVQLPLDMLKTIGVQH